MKRTLKHLTLRALIVLVILISLSCLIASGTFAGNVHFSKNNPPVFTPGAGTLTAVGTIYGIGPENVTIQLLATGVGGSAESIPFFAGKNGKITFTITTAPNLSITAWTNATIIVRDQSGAESLSQVFPIP